jgi:hypothetical protein
MFRRCALSSASMSGIAGSFISENIFVKFSVAVRACSMAFIIGAAPGIDDSLDMAGSCSG